MSVVDTGFYQEGFHYKIALRISGGWGSLVRLKLLDALDWDITLENVSSCYSLFLSNLASWTDKSNILAHEINTQGLLMTHLKHLLKLQQKEDEIDLAVFEKMAMEMLIIIYNCIKDPDLQRFYYGNTVSWIQVLSPWIQCSHSSLRMLVRFVLGCLRLGLSEDSLKLLDMDENDWKIFMTMFTDCCQPPHFIATMMGTMAPIMQQFTKLVAKTPVVAVQGASSSLPCEDQVRSHLLHALNYPLHELSVAKNNIVASVDTTDHSYTFSASEIMKALENFLSTEPNIKAFHSFVFWPHIKELLYHGGTKEKTAACSLLWSLARIYPDLQIKLRDEDSMMHLSLKQLYHNEDHNLQLLSKCLTISVDRNCHEELQMMYIRCCYQYKKYHDCIEHCSNVEHLVEAKIYKAKALYHIYTQEQVLLEAERSSLPPRLLHQKREACFSKTKTVISLLGRLFDDNDKAFDHECSQILDLAMIDYIHETNNLKDFQRCLLCRNVARSHCFNDPEAKKGEVSCNLVEMTEKLSVSRQKISTSTQSNVNCEGVEENTKHFGLEAQLGEPNTSKAIQKSQSTLKSERAKHKQGLQASHLFPEAIIKRFASAVPLAKGKKVCMMSGFRPSFDPMKDTLHSYGEATLYMLCHDCEQLLSKSESWFLQKFFSTVYDPGKPSKPSEEQSIPYNDHLYKFCVGLLFRLLNYDSSAVLNPDDIYCLFEQCRAVLRPESIPWSIKKPDVYLFFTPTDEEGDEYGLINQFLTATMTRLYGLHPLNTDLQSFYAVIPSFAHFIVIHMGVLNILVKFQPSADYEIDSRFLIFPEGGMYTVPQSTDRKRVIPPGVYTLFQIRAMEMERKWLEGPSLTYEPVQYPDEKVSETFGILKAEAMDESRVISERRLTHVSDDYPRSLCFLPIGFDINPLISIPNDHAILLHHTHGDREKGLIIFLGIGFDNSNGYGYDKPYIILYKYLPGYTFVSSYFISLEKMQPIGFLPKTRGISTVKNQEEILKDRQQEDIASIILCMLKEKGFQSLKSLINRLAAPRKLPLLDAQCTPCSSEELKRCAYCANKCDRCFKPVPKLAISLEGPEDSDLDFKFCSSKCYQICIEPPKSSCYCLIDSRGNLKEIDNKCNYVIPEGFIPSCGPVASSHKILLHILCFGTNWAGYLREDEIALCSGAFEQSQKQLYVVYHGHSITGQLCLEFFVSDDLSPSYPLPYLVTDDAIEEIKGLKDDDIIQPHLMHVIKIVSDITGLKMSMSTSSLSSDLLLALSLIFPSQNDENEGEIHAASTEATIIDDEDAMIIDLDLFNPPKTKN